MATRPVYINAITNGRGSVFVLEKYITVAVVLREGEKNANTHLGRTFLRADTGIFRVPNAMLRVARHGMT